MQFTDPTVRYVEMILQDEILYSKSVRQAVERFVEERKKDDWRWIFNEELAGKAVKFMELLPEPKSGKQMPLANFQKFIIGNLFGWVDKNDSTIRRFTDVLISLARKNGKSLLISGVIIYEFLFGKNPANKRQLFTAANDRKQASIVFGMVKDRLNALARIDDEIARSVKVNRDEITNLNDGSIIRPFSRDAGLVNGYEPQVAVVDEYADSKSTDMIETLSSGQTLLPSPMTFIISTAGFDLNAPMYKQNYPYAKKVLRGEEYAERYFAFIAEQEDIDDINYPERWIMSNPILEVPALVEQINGYLKERIAKGRGENNLNKVLTKNFNIWRQATEDSYMDIETWNAAKAETIPDIHGSNIWLGIDVGKTSDLFAITWLVPTDDNKWFVDGYGFVGTKYGLDNKIKSDRTDYRAVEARGEGEITKLESGIIDYERVYEWLDNFIISNDLQVQAICYDPYQYGTLLTKLEKNHPEWPQVGVRQGTMTLSMPTKQFKDDVIGGKIIHSDNELLTTAIANAVLMTDNNGVRINKNKYSNKIDMIDAVLDAYAIAFTENLDDYLTDEDVFNDEFGF